MNFILSRNILQRYETTLLPLDLSELTLKLKNNFKKKNLLLAHQVVRGGSLQNHYFPSRSYSLCTKPNSRPKPFPPPPPILLVHSTTTSFSLASPCFFLLFSSISCLLISSDLFLPTPRSYLPMHPRAMPLCPTTLPSCLTFLVSYSTYTMNSWRLCLDLLSDA